MVRGDQSMVALGGKQTHECVHVLLSYIVYQVQETGSVLLAC